MWFFYKVSALDYKNGPARHMSYSRAHQNLLQKIQEYSSAVTVVLIKLVLAATLAIHVSPIIKKCINKVG